MAQTENPTSSNLTSVVREDVHKWDLLEPTARLSELHARFWGDSVADERRDWWSNHQGEVMVGSNEVDEDCFVLNYDFGLLDRSVLWVRRDYVRIYEYCHQHCERAKNNPQRIAPSFILTGQPGIGKSYWISYAVRRRLGEGKAFLWCRGNFCYLFVKEGVFKMRLERLDSTVFYPFIWTFTDADDTSQGVLFSLAEKMSKLFIIYISPPEREQWKNLRKTTSSLTVIMNPWTKDEIFQAARTQDIEPAEKQRIGELFDQYGGIPRICLDFLRNPDDLAELQDDSENALRDLTVWTLCDHISKAAYLSFSDVPYTIFMVKRTDPDNLGTMTIVPTSPAIEMKLKSKIRALQHAEQIQLIDWLARKKPMAGLVFEALAQSVFQRRVILKLVPMQKRSSGPGSTIRWVSTHEGQSLHTTKGSDADMDRTEAHSSIIVKFSPRKTVEHKGATIHQEQEIEGVFFVPKSTNQATFDSFIVSDGFLYIFRFSIAAEHDIDQGLVSFFSRQALLDRLPPKTRWYFIFVIPSGNSISCPQPRDRELAEFLKDVRLFSAQLRLDKDPARDDREGDMGDGKESVSAKDDETKRRALDDSGMVEAEGTKRQKSGRNESSKVQKKRGKGKRARK
ncbi:hypothetical protein BC826DRAFT_1183413 [Russula brevipes]|nr:hypothetical protein BC826DRAFT_1183413 [Russula brevipes]